MNAIVEALKIKKKSTIRETMRVITVAASKGAPTGIALVIDDQEKLAGVVTDGDIRRALVGDVGIDSPIDEIMVENPITVPKGLTEPEMLQVVTEKVMVSGRIHDVKVDQVIVVDDSGYIDDVLNFFEIWKSSDLKKKSICVVGLGFVGLTLAVVLADVGYKVIGYDVNGKNVKDINNGDPPFHENGLSTLLKFHVMHKNFRAVQTLDNTRADIYVVSVGTPIGEDNEPNLNYIKKVAGDIGQVLKKRDLVLMRSTVPVGTTRNLVAPILEKTSGLGCGEDFFLAFAPERTIEGKALEELRTLPQVVGGINRRSQDAAAGFFSNLNDMIVRVATLEAAEMVKLVNNAYRDLTFAFANELALVCEQWGLDAVKVIFAANEGYSRNKIPVPSPGVGGICLKKDPYIYLRSAKEVSYEAQLPKYSRQINEYMIEFVYHKVNNFMQEHKNGDPIKVFLVGHSFKGEPETSDVRASTTLDLIEIIKANTSWNIYGYDPIVSKGLIEAHGVKGSSLREGFDNADCVLIMNNHRSYLEMDILGLVQLMKKPGFLFDGWHLFPYKEIEEVEGIYYGGLSGRN